MTRRESNKAWRGQHDKYERKGLTKERKIKDSDIPKLFHIAVTYMTKLFDCNDVILGFQLTGRHNKNVLIDFLMY